MSETIEQLYAELRRQTHLSAEDKIAVSAILGPILHERDDLRAKLDSAQKACAEMREWIGRYSHTRDEDWNRKYCLECGQPPVRHLEKCSIPRLLSSDCGKGYLSPEEAQKKIDAAVGPLVEALKAMLAAAPHEGEGMQRALACEKANEALVHAKAKGLIEPEG